LLALWAARPAAVEKDWPDRVRLLAIGWLAFPVAVCIRTSPFCRRAGRKMIIPYAGQ
jgi:hypothetical protein